MCACAFVCTHRGRGAAVSSLMLEDLEEGSRALKLMWRVGLSQAERFQRGLPGGSRAADFMSFVLKSHCLLNLFQPAAAMLNTVPPPYPLLLHNTLTHQLLLHNTLTHQPSVNTHTHTSVIVSTQWNTHSLHSSQCYFRYFDILLVSLLLFLYMFY